MTNIEGILNRTLMKELIKQLPETVYEMLDKGVNLIPDPRPTNVVQLNFGNLVYKKPDENVADVSGGQWKESEFLFDIVQNSTPEGKQRILTHPLIKAFLSLKSPKYWLSFGGFYCVWIVS
ncbi:unnamed protein product [Allacma fusca]|uniref:Uncharacterized protein n=1 Tax=Allacma fusca TaxID=39272 RepID=A0A8J2PAC8_9HEXA|nr:unnamed protein product [Allacma fusca]